MIVGLCFMNATDRLIEINICTKFFFKLPIQDKVKARTRTIYAEKTQIP